MSDQRLTQCPHCKASFKVSEEQLNAANGRVRCGACMNIFDAIAYSLSNNPPAKPSPKEEKTENLEEEIPDYDELFADNPDEDTHDPRYSGNSLDSDEFSTSFLELDSADPSDPYSTSFQEVDSEIDTRTSSDAIDESWTQDILDDIKHDQNNKKVEPGFFDSPDQSSAQANNKPETEKEFTSAESSFSEHHHYENNGFQYTQDSPNKRHWFVSLLFILANITLIITLLGQAIWFHYEKLAKYPKVKEYYQLACQHLSCTLPKLEDMNKIKSNNLVVRSHPTQRKSLIIDTVIVNEASYNQAFPNLALYFSDINKNIVAQRLFEPHEYLSGDLLTWNEMPIDQPIHISLEIVDPGKQAVNYTLKFFSPDS